MLKSDERNTLRHSMAQQKIQLTVMRCTPQKSYTEELESSHHREMIEAEGEEYADYPDLIITQCMHESKHQIMLHMYSNYCVNQKI